MNFAGNIVGIEAHHQTAGVGPGLRTEVADIGNGDPRFLHGLAGYGFLQRFAGLYETCHQSVVVAFEVLGSDQQHLVTTMYQHDDGSGQLGPYLLTTFCTLF